MRAKLRFSPQFYIEFICKRLKHSYLLILHSLVGALFCVTTVIHAPLFSFTSIHDEYIDNPLLTVELGVISYNEHLLMARNKKNYNKNNRHKNKRHKNRNKKNSGKSNHVFIPKFHWNQNQGIAGRFAGVLEINEKGWGLIRKLDHEFSYHPKDPFLKPDEVKDLDLRQGLILEGEFEEDHQGNRHVASVDSINHQSLETWAKCSKFERQTPIMPVDWIRLGDRAQDTEMRVIDLVAPIGKGQRALIVAPPRTGKTVY